MSHPLIKKVAIVGGTHGNEITGVFLVRKYEQYPNLIRRDSFEILTLLANPKAIEEGRRYIDADLNRCFKAQDLQNPKLINYEQLLAKQLAFTIGQSKINLIIDLHSTTSNMGLTVILHNNHPYLLGLAAYLSTINPLVKVLQYPPNQDHSYLRSLCELGFAIEVGPVAQGTLNAELFLQTEALISSILDFIELCNQAITPEIPKTFTLYQQVKAVDYPRDELQQIRAMIYPQLQFKDYEILHTGDPLFLGFDGEVIDYQGESSIFPIFINEAAYYEKHIAMSLAIKQEVTL
ncbi:aspartoacylase [Nostoc sp. LEGE 12447]|uniref:aspartoacylase n=1 Tax=Nostoc sp. LEGE 12447 TaxID=1828640 RepID=UPI00188406DF|nr:aspartoacylase [Nostoc sp. LEGE 12447]MBE9002507.1 aspartoacylase [Nostoc sp. LEGE 12447]